MTGRRHRSGSAQAYAHAAGDFQHAVAVRHKAALAGDLLQGFSVTWPFTMATVTP